jgi:HMG-box domain
MGKKSAARTPYFHYMVEYQKKHQTNHRMEELMLLCAPSWAQMSSRDREVYEKLAKANKSGPSSSTTGSYERYSAQNIPLSLVGSENSMKISCAIMAIML